MKSFVLTIASLAAVSAFASQAYAQAEDSVMSDYSLLLVSPSGHVMQRKMTDTAMSEMMMKDATPITSDTIIMMHGGKMYMVHDRKMPDGKMMSDKIMTMK